MNPGRGQSTVVGVALLLAVTVVALGALTAGIGSVVEENAETADARRVADDLTTALPAVETSGAHRGQVAFTAGRLQTVERDLRIMEDNRVVGRVRVDALVADLGSRRVAYLAGAVVRGRPGNAVLHHPPPVSGSRGDGVLVVGAPTLGGRVAVSGEPVRVTLRTTVHHDRRDLGTGRFALALETATPGPLARWFRGRDATVTVEDLDGDGVPSVVARFEGKRQVYLVVHRLGLEVVGSG